MKTINYYLAVDLDTELFKDDKGNQYTSKEVKELINKSLIRDISTKERLRVDLTMMAARLINEFNFDFTAARKFYETIS